MEDAEYEAHFDESNKKNCKRKPACIVSILGGLMREI
jgi:hypothetical protein